MLLLIMTPLMMMITKIQKIKQGLGLGLGLGVGLGLGLGVGLEVFCLYLNISI